MLKRDHKAAIGAYGVGCVKDGLSGTKISHLLYCEASLSRSARRSGDRLVIRATYKPDFADSMQVCDNAGGVGRDQKELGDGGRPASVYRCHALSDHDWWGTFIAGDDHSRHVEERFHSEVYRPTIFDASLPRSHPPRAYSYMWVPA